MFTVLLVAYQLLFFGLKSPVSVSFYCDTVSVLFQVVADKKSKSLSKFIKCCSIESEWCVVVRLVADLTSRVFLLVHVYCFLACLLAPVDFV